MAFRKDVHVLMYETDSSLERDPASPLYFFKERSNIAALKTTVFGGDLDYHGFGDKYQTLRPLLELLDKTKLVILADARDVILNVPEDSQAASRAVDQFMDAYHRLTRDAPNAVVMSAESQCCVSAMSHAHPGDYFDAQTMKRQKRACASGTEGCWWDENKNIYSWVEFMHERAFNDTGIDYVGDVYLNAGLMVGYPSDLMKLLDAIDIGPSEDDQAVLSGLMYSFPEMIVLDYDQEMFGNNQWPRGLEAGCVFDGTTSSSRLMHRETGTEPLIVHTPGKFYGCLDVLIEELGGASLQRYLATHPEGNPRRTNEPKIRRRLLRKNDVTGRNENNDEKGMDKYDEDDDNEEGMDENEMDELTEDVQETGEKEEKEDDKATDETLEEEENYEKPKEEKAMGEDTIDVDGDDDTKNGNRKPDNDDKEKVGSEEGTGMDPVDGESLEMQETGLDSHGGDQNGGGSHVIGNDNNKNSDEDKDNKDKKDKKDKKDNKDNKDDDDDDDDDKDSKDDDDKDSKDDDDKDDDKDEMDISKEVATIDSVEETSPEIQDGGLGSDEGSNQVATIDGVEETSPEIQDGGLGSDEGSNQVATIDGVEETSPEIQDGGLGSDEGSNQIGSSKDGQYGNYGYGVYGNYGYGIYGVYGNYGYGSFGEAEEFLLSEVNIARRKRRVRQAIRLPRSL
jgi:hypothetical protein